MRTMTDAAARLRFAFRQFESAVAQAERAGRRDIVARYSPLALAALGSCAETVERLVRSLRRGES